MHDVRLIDANALMKRICGHECGMHPEDCDGMESETVPCNFHAYVSDAPTINAQPVKLGRWIECDSQPNQKMCSSCRGVGVAKDIAQFFTYCPFCGAFMRGDKDGR